MNKQAQTGTLWIIVSILFTIAIWAVFAAPQLNYWGNQAVIAGNYTGLPYLFYQYINVWVGLGLIGSIFLAAYGGNG